MNNATSSLLMSNLLNAGIISAICKTKAQLSQQKIIFWSTYTDNMAWVEHENKRARLPLVVDVTQGAENAHHAHKRLDGCRLKHVPLSKVLVLLGEGFFQLVEAGPHGDIVHGCLWKVLCYGGAVVKLTMITIVARMKLRGT